MNKRAQPMHAASRKNTVGAAISICISENRFAIDSEFAVLPKGFDESGVSGPLLLSKTLKASVYTRSGTHPSN